MPCSGLHSFEVHCGKNAKQHHWKQIFKVAEKGVLMALLCFVVQ